MYPTKPSNHVKGPLRQRDEITRMPALYHYQSKIRGCYLIALTDQMRILFEFHYYWDWELKYRIMIGSLLLKHQAKLQR